MLSVVSCLSGYCVCLGLKSNLEVITTGSVPLIRPTTYLTFAHTSGGTSASLGCTRAGQMSPAKILYIVYTYAMLREFSAALNMDKHRERLFKDTLLSTVKDSHGLPVSNWGNLGKQTTLIRPRCHPFATYLPQLHFPPTPTPPIPKPPPLLPQYEIMSQIRETATCTKYRINGKITVGANKHGLLWSICLTRLP